VPPSLCNGRRRGGFFDVRREGRAVYGKRRIHPWLRPLIAIGTGIGIVLLCLILSRLLLFLFYVFGVLLFVLIGLWVLWRWWWR